MSIVFPVWAYTESSTLSPTAEPGLIRVAALLELLMKSVVRVVNLAITKPMHRLLALDRLQPSRCPSPRRAQ